MHSCVTVLQNQTENEGFTIFKTQRRMNIVDLTNTSDEEEEESQNLAPKQQYQLVVRGQPIPKPSPRARFKFKGFSRTGKPLIQTWIHNPVTTEMKTFALGAREQLGEQQVLSFPVFPSGPVSLKVWFCCSPPLNYFVNKDRGRPKGNFLDSVLGRTNPVPVSVKPDDDNLLKFVLDALTAVMWKDDNQVAAIAAYKCYDTQEPYTGRTIVEVEPAVIEAIPEKYKFN